VVLSGAVGEREPGIPDGWIEHPIPRRKGKPGAAGYGKNATVLIVSVAATGLDSDYRHIRPLFSGRATKGHNATKSYSEVEVKSLYGATQTQTGRVFNRPATETFTHDADGNLTQDGRWTYVWDGENRLIEMKRDTDTPAGARQRLVFEYDHQGRRIRKQFYTHSGSNWVLSSDTAFAYDGWNLVGELNAAASNARLRTFLWGLDLSGTEQGAGGVGGLWLVIDYTSGTTYHWPAYDGNGNVAALVAQANGSLSARYEYGPFGEPVRATGTMARKNPFRFSTKFTDNETGLIYYGYRFYDPVTGRWVNRDPIHDVASLPSQARAIAATRAYLDHEHSGALIYDAFGFDDGLNPYHFVHNVATAEVDTLGTGILCRCPAFAGPVPTPTWTPIGPPFWPRARVATMVWTVPCIPRTIPAKCGIGCGAGVCAYTAVWLWRYVNWFGTMTWAWVVASGPNYSGDNCP
jgi:RHS repeat-associated protein